MFLLRAELATHLPTKDVVLNGDMLAARSKHKHLQVFQDSPFPGFHQKQTQNPAAKFSTLLVHWVQNYSNTL